jgi:hypothetical protein
LRRLPVGRVGRAPGIFEPCIRVVRSWRRTPDERMRAAHPVKGSSRLIVLVSAGLATACMPSTPEARRAAYLDCARDQGLRVEGGTIVTRSAADLARLDACEAVPR